MHILFLTDNFPPESNAPANRTYDHAVEWIAAGHQVTVITCAPNFPDGRVFKGYQNKLRQEEILDGITVIRVWTFMTANQGLFLRTLDFLSYMVSSFFAGLGVKRPDVVVGTSPQFFTACSAYLLAKLKRKPYVFEVRDIWPESIISVGMVGGNILAKILTPVSRFLYLRASKIVVVTNASKEILVDVGVARDKITVVRNGSSQARFQPRSSDPQLVKSLELRDRFVIGYVGTHGMAHKLETILTAARLAIEDKALKHVVFLFVGSGAELTRLQRLSKKLSNVVIVGQVNREEITRYWSVVDLALTHLRDTPLFRSVIPSKIFEAMAMGVPILHGVKGESAEIITSFNAGLTFYPENPDDLLSVAKKIIYDEKMRDALRRGAIEASKCFNRKVQAKVMLECLLEVHGVDAH
jgi:glycosyltransferase involved in cell wall biosynthesis